MSYLINFPTELFRILVKYCDVTDLGRLRRVCTAFSSNKQLIRVITESTDSYRVLNTQAQIEIYGEFIPASHLNHSEEKIIIYVRKFWDKMTQDDWNAVSRRWFIPDTILEEFGLYLNWDIACHTFTNMSDIVLKLAPRLTTYQLAYAKYSGEVLRQISHHIDWIEYLNHTPHYDRLEYVKDIVNWNELQKLVPVKILRKLREKYPEYVSPLLHDLDGFADIFDL